VTPKTPKKGSSERLRELWPDIKELIRPRRGMLALGFLLMAIGTPCGLVLPASTKYLVDNVIGKKQIHLLLPLVLAIGGADGFSDLARAAAEHTISLGKMTLAHELARVVLLEQVYRAFTILKGHPYHSGH